MTTNSNNFADFLIAAAKQKRRRIVLPESGDSRVLAAAAKAQLTGIADCILLGETATVCRHADEAGIDLPTSVAVETPNIDQLAPLLAKWRAHKGLTEEAARVWLQTDATAAAAAMVRAQEADGMVAGAATTSAAVLRPVLQIIGPAKDADLVSSCFLMCLPQGIKIFADCALNVRPTAAQLSSIAVQSAQTAVHFGVSPVVALLSYATGDSATSDEVARVSEATTLTQALLPDIPVAGPIQYDAAVSPIIASQKAPQWKAAGKATVLVFPDVASGNITYKAVQQTAKIVAIGPLMQGLAAPANDLSRGATVNDICYTIAATAAQG
ncbi:phosphate acyltransferase [Candidatus Persebacteraceae bacterium Df01]|jgi:phosphate acetyltransferase|uniref:Phosphate acyltransferase n=1 Tax=Candidatus Doriopsillibacter californiensis TaxID=2970740 RepID=A0ABT7QKG4_9GAMM|nr:phosphate acyltransferase [Candidatus Persebacteraceae bacterium Df01]